MEASHGTPFLFVPVFLGLGAVGYFLHPAEPSLTPILFAAGLLFIVWRYRLSVGRRGWITGAVLCVAIGALLAKAETMRVRSVMLGGGVTATIDMRVLRVDRDGRQMRILGEVIATRSPQLKFQPSRVRVSVPAARGSFAAGDVITGRFGLRAPGGPVRPGSYDFAFHAYFAGVGASGFAMGPVVKADAPAPTALQAGRFKLENLRADIAQKVRAAIPGTSGNVAAALIAGVTGGIDSANEEALRVTGLAHVLSISGLHMALVAGAVLFIVRFSFALFPAFASRRPVKKWAAGAALATSFLYLLLSGGAVATLRSFIMLAVMLGAVMLDRQALTLRNLAIAAIAILVVTPHEIMGPSFQMSFAATAALISAYGWVSRRREGNLSSRQWPVVGNIAMAAVLTPVVAGLATAIFSAWHFHRLAPMGLPANLAAMPVISFVIMPFAMIGTVAMPFGLEEWPLKIMGHGVDAMLWIARWCAALSPQDTVGALVPAAFVLMVLSLLMLTLCQSRIRLFALALVPAALAVAWSMERPDLLISEDARLVAVAADDEALAVNRTRPNAFTTQVWRNAMVAGIVAKPEMLAGPGEGQLAAENPGAAPRMDTPELPVLELVSAARSLPGRFACGRGACFALVEGKAIVAWLDPAAFGSSGSSDSKSAAGQAEDQNGPKEPDDESTAGSRAFARFFFETCARADLVVTASAMPFRGCGRGKAMLIRASDLARQGAAEIRFKSAAVSGINGGSWAAASVSDAVQQNFQINQSDERDISESSAEHSPAGASLGSGRTDRIRPAATSRHITVQYAIGEPVRPWNRERVFSRAARNVPEFQRDESRKPKFADVNPPPAKTEPPEVLETVDD